jgi:hypothetical protein
VKGEIKYYETPNEATILEIFELVNEKGAGVDRIRWDGCTFHAFGTKSKAGRIAFPAGSTILALVTLGPSQLWNPHLKEDGQRVFAENRFLDRFRGRKYSSIEHADV